MPGFEEAYYLARWRDQLAPAQLFAPPVCAFALLHTKVRFGRFVARAAYSRAELRVLTNAGPLAGTVAIAGSEPTPMARHEHRQRHARPIQDELRSLMDEALPQVPPTSATGMALNYLHNEWDKLIRHLDDGSAGDQQQRCGECNPPLRVGRKNWFFSASVTGIKASANLYSLIETAKASGLGPYAYLRYLFTELPKAETVEAIVALMPGTINKDQIKLC